MLVDVVFEPDLELFLLVLQLNQRIEGLPLLSLYELVNCPRHRQHLDIKQLVILPHLNLQLLVLQELL